MNPAPTDTMLLIAAYARSTEATGQFNAQMRAESLSIEAGRCPLPEDRGYVYK